MTTYYVGIGGNDGNNGTTWALRKLTLNGAEDIPVAANDTVYVGPGVYREMLTCDVSGAAGQPITYIGDVTGEHTDGVGGIVRITGSDNDQTATRASCITAVTKNYRTFRGLAMDICTANLILCGTGGGTNWILEDCTFQGLATNLVLCQGAGQAAWIVRRCSFIGVGSNGSCISFFHTAVVDNTGHIVENCTLAPGIYAATNGVNTTRVGGVTVRNCVVIGASNGFRIITALNAGQTFTVNSCLIFGCATGLNAVAADGTFVEDYNSISQCNAARTNVNIGANSNTYPPVFDLGLLHAGAGQVSGFRLPQPRFGALSSWSQVRAIADGGTNATLDLNGLTRPVTDGKRSWGAVQYQNQARETTTVRTGSAAMSFADYGRKQFKVPCTNVATTVSVYCYREANYAGTNPTMIIKQAGVADRATTDAGAAGGWNLLTDTFTPAAVPGWFTVELCSLNTDAANPATNDVFFDDLVVSVNSTLGQMETWLWDTEVADWVQAAGAGGGMPSISPCKGGMIG